MKVVHLFKLFVSSLVMRLVSELGEDEECGGAHGHGCPALVRSPRAGVELAQAARSAGLGAGNGEINSPGPNRSEFCCPASLSGDGTGQSGAEQGRTRLQERLSQRPAAGAACHNRSRPAPDLGGPGRAGAGLPAIS